GALVADYGGPAGSEDGRHPHPIAAQLRAADGVDTGEHGIEPARGGRVLDRAFGVTPLEQLPPRDDPMLQPHDPSLDFFGPHTSPKGPADEISPPCRAVSRRKTPPRASTPRLSRASSRARKACRSRTTPPRRRSRPRASA